MVGFDFILTTTNKQIYICLRFSFKRAIKSLVFGILQLFSDIMELLEEGVFVDRNSKTYVREEQGLYKGLTAMVAEAAGIRS